MAAGDTLQKITPQDALIFDTNSNLVGIKNPRSVGNDLNVSSLVSGAGISTPFTVNSRDGLGRVTSYTEGTTTFTVTYGAFGVDTISGGGKVRTVARNASGQITGVTDA
jgi:hypothetical protein